ncbi:hypothetical protein [Frankia sp. BMG5.23]|uniref:hypothetical protein n=1 Tax=Frankia sp. BMG5.23 TaxID=683305 RepID=UPI000460F52A|nr:hypothetical protein [Frankia sp. BMG5.23]KDA42836.1 hypothetical protein BMG523Draft_02386 [Frankia sp. BMG5.23]
MTAEPVFRLLRPEHLPSPAATRELMLAAVPDVSATLAATLQESEGTVLAAVREALALVPLPAGTVEGGPDAAESTGNRDNDGAFAIVRVDGDRHRLLVHTVLTGYEVLLDDVLRSGSGLDAAQWTRLREGFAALLAHLTGFDATVLGGHRPVPLRAGAGSSDALRRWIRGHRIFMVYIQGLIVAVDELADAVKRAAADQAMTALELAVTLMLASESALRFAGDFTPEEYENLVRPTLTPPVAPAGLSGLHWRDHEYLIRRLAESGRLLAGLDPALVPLRARFREAYAATYDAHRFVCARFVGDEAGSLLMTPKSKQSAVGVLAHYKRVRLQQVPE